MDFYVDLAVAVLLRIVKDRRNSPKFYRELAKVHVKLEDLATLDPAYARTLKEKRGESQ